MITLSKKVCLLGDFAVGKTSLVRRFVYNRFDDKYISTIGVNVSRKTIHLPRQGEMAELTLMVWDLAGSEEFTPMRVSYIRGAAGAILVCDLTRADSLAALEANINDMLSVNTSARFILAANKRDLADQAQLAESDIQAIADHWAMPYYLTSAKTGDEVELLFRQLGQMLL